MCVCVCVCVFVCARVCVRARASSSSLTRGWPTGRGVAPKRPGAQDVLAKTICEHIRRNTRCVHRLRAQVWRRHPQADTHAVCHMPRRGPHHCRSARGALRLTRQPLCTSACVQREGRDCGCAGICSHNMRSRDCVFYIVASSGRMKSCSSASTVQLGGYVAHGGLAAFLGAKLDPHRPLPPTATAVGVKEPSRYLLVWPVQAHIL